MFWVVVDNDHPDVPTSDGVKIMFRNQQDIVASEQLAQIMNATDPATDPAGWQISDTGTVWTEAVAFPGTKHENRAQVIAMAPGFLLLMLPLVGVDGIFSAEDFLTLAGATAYLEVRS